MAETGIKSKKVLKVRIQLSY